MAVEREHFIEELLFALKEQDPIKLGVLIENIGWVDHTTQRRLVFELSRTEVELALPLLVKLAISRPDLIEDHPEIRDVLIAKSQYNNEDLYSLIQKETISDMEFISTLAERLSL